MRTKNIQKLPLLITSLCLGLQLLGCGQDTKQANLNPNKSLSIENKLLENTDNPNSVHSQEILKSDPQTWQETLYKFYFRANRFYKQIIYYIWRFGEIHSYKLVLFMMVLVATLKVKQKYILLTIKISFCFI